MAAVADAQAGDSIEVADGDYDNTDAIFIDKKVGSVQSPVVIRAANRGEQLPHRHILNRSVNGGRNCR